MERKSNGLTFSDGLLVDLGGRRTAKRRRSRRKKKGKYPQISQITQLKKILA